MSGPAPDRSPLPDPWIALRQWTAARIATGRVGGSLPTSELLRFDLDHACARDAVHSELDLDALEAALAPIGVPVVRVQTCAPDRATYLLRPDRGRTLQPPSRAQLEQLARDANRTPDLAIVIADGLSAVGVQAHVPPLLQQLIPRLKAAQLTLAPLILCRHGRVALQDDVGRHLASRACLILLGERPGLAAADSVGAYFVVGPRIGNTDAQRNCVSNIRPAGLPLAAATETLEYLVTEGLRRQVSGTALKDERQLPGLRAARLP